MWTEKPRSWDRGVRRNWYLNFFHCDGIPCRESLTILISHSCRHCKKRWSYLIEQISASATLTCGVGSKSTHTSTVGQAGLSVVAVCLLACSACRKILYRTLFSY